MCVGGEDLDACACGVRLDSQLAFEDGRGVAAVSALTSASQQNLSATFALTLSHPFFPSHDLLILLCSAPTEPLCLWSMIT